MPAAPVHVVHLIPGLGRAGAETALTRLVQHSDPRLVRHTVVSLTDRGALAEAIEAAGGTVVTLGMGGPASALLHLPRLRRCVRDLRPDVLQGWMVHANLLAWLVRSLGAGRLPLAWNLRSSAKNLVHERPLTRLLTRLAGLASPGVDMMIANSSAAMSDFLGLGYAPRAHAVVANGFDVSVFRPDPADREASRRALGLAPGTVAFGLVGRFHLVKGHRLLVEAAAEVARARPDVAFVLAGTGTDSSPELDALLARQGVADRFVRLGERSDVPTVMRALDVLCAPSFHEGFPNAVGEAMACAVPCVATDVSDVRAILGDAGAVIPPGSAPDLAEAMLRMIDLGPEGRQALGRLGRARVEAAYSIEAASLRYQRIYLELAEAAAPASLAA